MQDFKITRKAAFRLGFFGGLGFLVAGGCFSLLGYLAQWMVYAAVTTGQSL